MDTYDNRLSTAADSDSRDDGANQTSPAAAVPLARVVTLSELCAHLHVPIQTLYDLRSQGRGPRGFRVGRELRFRAGEIEAWLASLEAEDARRHRPDAEAG
ncbi:MAG: helix-turn-helix transcriptional regulator [Nocardioides sp.]|uniref:helix-turn-helix transcriptional regulator n=1 Tax=Nocardioides sp. TaxID=35761 RepID=UPI003D6AEEAC